MIRTNPFRAALLLILLLCGGGSHAADHAAQARELERLRSQIRAVQAELKRERARHDDLGGELRGLEQNIGRIVGRLRRLDEQQADKQRRIDGLRKEYAGEEARLKQQRSYLAQQMLSAYALGQQAYLKLLLNQEDPASLDRQLVYYRYLNDARAERIRAALAQLERFKLIERSLQEELAELDRVRKQQLAEQEQLAAARREREQALARLEAAITEKGQQLTRLQGDEKQLQKVLEELRNALADIHQDPRLKQRPFKDSRGRLDWPLEGELAARFGQARGLGDMSWSGLVIEGKSGTGVRAVSHGHVVFADWLRGMGLLLIIDHGDGYMTLYGHNEAIYKEAGDWVQAGEVIATVGASGGRRKPGLYFEIRAGGKPVDPLAWLRPRRGA